MHTPSRLQQWLPFLHWGRHYSRELLGADLVAASVVTLMLIPQSLAYALLAGLPPQTGLYASMAPLVLYALAGSSSTLAVGPAAVTSLMTATAIAAVAGPDDGSLQLQAALWLALLSGSMMLLMGALRLGFVAHFLSHPVISGFVSASGLLIAASQFKHLVGISAHGDTLVGLLPQLFKQLPSMHGPSLAMGLAALTLLVLARRNAKPLLLRGGLSAFWADLVA
ncbi:MAG: hypothetical protein RL323_722, partial [Pseudomonadota bacterium]